MATLADLLRFKRAVDIKDEQDNTLLTVWVRVLGDADLQEAYKLSRVASAKKRAELKDNTSDAYLDEVAVFETATKDECIQTIVASKSSNFTAEAISANDRDELPTLKDIALDPDAPTLEEQEKLEFEKLQRELNYQKKLEEFVKTKTTELEAILNEDSLENLRIQAQVEAVNIIALTVFVTTLNEQKVWRAIYEDEQCTKKAFRSINELKDLHTYVKDQLLIAYHNLEMSPDEIKNS